MLEIYNDRFELKVRTVSSESNPDSTSEHGVVMCSGQTVIYLLKSVRCRMRRECSFLISYWMIEVEQTIGR